MCEPESYVRSACWGAPPADRIASNVVDDEDLPAWRYGCVSSNWSELRERDCVQVCEQRTRTHDTAST